MNRRTAVLHQSLVVLALFAVSCKDGQLYRVYLNARQGGWWRRRGSSLE